MEKPTRLSLHWYTSGMGDLQAAEQFTDAFDAFVKQGDPGWGEVVINAGIHGGALESHKGDLNLYWWWTGSDRDDWLDYYVGRANPKPQMILCTSRKMYDHAKKGGYKACYLSGATGPDYFPMDLPRSGTGYCGTKNHKPKAQMDAIIEPAKAFGFEWKTIVEGGRPVLNRWYNGLSVCLGMTATVTESWGVVPTRTYEVLGGANPYITYRHSTMSDELGFDYPWQSGSAEETTAMLKELVENYGAHKAEFFRYSQIVREKHTWANRMLALRDVLNAQT